MSFIGAVGVVAQQGNQAVTSAPTGVSVATSSSGNYDDAIATQAHDGSFQSQIHNQLGVVFNNHTGETELDITALNNYSAGNSIAIRISAFLRATGATSYTWDLSGLSDGGGVLSFLPSLNTTSMSTAQDSTFGNSSHLGGFVVISAGGGRGGLTWGSAGNWIQFVVTGTATNGVGSTGADEITLKIVWTAGDSGD